MKETLYYRKEFYRSGDEDQFNSKELTTNGLDDLYRRLDVLLEKEKLL